MLVGIVYSLRIARPHISESVSFTFSPISSLPLYFSPLPFNHSLPTIYMYRWACTRGGCCVSLFYKTSRYPLVANVFLNIRYLLRSVLYILQFLYILVYYIAKCFIFAGNHIIGLLNWVLKAVLLTFIR